jgi:excisionase family DNA binding protein
LPEHPLDTPMLTPAEVATILAVPQGTLTTWRQNGSGPRWVRVGRHVRYARAELERWLREQTLAPKSAA